MCELPKFILTTGPYISDQFSQMIYREVRGYDLTYKLLFLGGEGNYNLAVIDLLVVTLNL